MKKKSIILIILSILIIISFICIGGLVYYHNSLKPVDKDSKDNITFKIKTGESVYTIIENLKKENLIKSDLTMKIYTKLHPGSLKAGDYILTKSMSAIDIYNIFIDGKATFDTVWVTFVEGKRLSYIVDVITKNFDFSKDEVNAVLEDKEYLKSLVERYDVLTEDIFNEGIYHPLEGYLFPDTYEFVADISIKGIIERMLDNTESKLSGYIDKIESSGYSIHEIVTLASIVELEGARSDDRNGVAGVFYNRLKKDMTLGSDVTTYYAVGKDFNVDLSITDLSSCNGYNTRGNCVKGLPIGPIASPSLESLKATLNPEIHDYLFFVADKNGKTYFTKTNAEHESTCNRLKQQGLWFVY